MRVPAKGRAQGVRVRIGDLRVVERARRFSGELGVEPCFHHGFRPGPGGGGSGSHIDLVRSAGPAPAWLVYGVTWVRYPLAEQLHFQLFAHAASRWIAVSFILICTTAPQSHITGACLPASSRSVARLGAGIGMVGLLGRQAAGCGASGLNPALLPGCFKGWSRGARRKNTPRPEAAGCSEE